MMPIVALSVTEAKLFAAVLCVQDMMMVLRIMNVMGLKLEVGPGTSRLSSIFCASSAKLASLSAAGKVEMRCNQTSSPRTDLDCSLRSTPPSL
eukprot:13477428-Ditylum_brightwellii.AAC.1